MLLMCLQNIHITAQNKKIADYARFARQTVSPPKKEKSEKTPLSERLSTVMIYQKNFQSLWYLVIT